MKDSSEQPNEILKRKPSFVFHEEWLPLFRRIRAINESAANDLLEALFEYNASGAIADFGNRYDGELKGRLDAAFEMISDRMLKDLEKYNDVCKQNSENRRKRNKTTDNDCNDRYQSLQSVTTSTDKDKDKEEDINNIIIDENYSKLKKKRGKSAFVKPTLEEVEAYIREKSYNVDPEMWYAHYESNGWKIGKNPMKSWKACLLKWSKNDFGQGQGKGTSSKEPQYGLIENGDDDFKWQL